MNIVKEIFKHIIWWIGLISIVIFITFVTYNIENKTDGLVVLLSGTFSGVIISINFANTLWDLKEDKK